jgi:hypothetical protein
MANLVLFKLTPIYKYIELDVNKRTSIEYRIWIDLIYVLTLISEAFFLCLLIKNY